MPDDAIHPVGTCITSSLYFLNTLLVYFISKWVKLKILISHGLYWTYSKGTCYEFIQDYFVIFEILPHQLVAMPSESAM